MRDLVFISAQPADLYFAWQVDVQLNNFRKFGYSDKAHVLVFLKQGEQVPKFWRALMNKYTEAQFFFAQDTDRIESHYIVNFKYPPLLRPWILKEYFKENPSLTKAALFYHDSDIVFTKKLDFSPFIEDDINYLSWTGDKSRGDNYLNYNYFERKKNQVDATKLQQYLEADPLKKFAEMFDLSTETIKANNEKTGGAQYILKDINPKFWADVFDGCLFIKIGMHNYNQKYFEGGHPQERENNGFQAWCADMWSVLWNLWKRGRQTECPPELDFCWATDPIARWDETYIYHDAGKTEGTDLFNKKGPWVDHPEDFFKQGTKRQVACYASNLATPFEDDLSWVNKNFCSWKYVQEIEETKNSNVKNKYYEKRPIT